VEKKVKVRKKDVNRKGSLLLKMHVLRGSIRLKDYRKKIAKENQRRREKN
jgi:hypothetical protein